jgi:cytoskeletal protein RodZ
MTIGETFKQARKKMGLDLDQVAAKTKITKNFLEAIENDELDRLPGEVYARHFLKIYSRLVKIDEDIVISEYHQQYGVKPHSVAHQEQTRKDDADFKRERMRNVVIATFTGVILSLVVLLLLNRNGTLTLFFNDDASPETVTNTRHLDPVNETPAPVVRETEPEAMLPETTAAALDDEEPPVVNQESPIDNTVVEVANLGEDSDERQPLPLETEEEPVSEDSSAVEQSPTLPLENLENVLVVGGNGESIEDVFIIEALEDVRVEVFIDGVSKTNRLLRKGMVRAYPFGNYHTVTVYDASRVAIQERRSLMSIPNRPGALMMLRDWQPGELKSTIDEWAENPDQ